MFERSRGDRPAIPNFLFIITDGHSDNATQTWIEAMTTRAQGVTILAVCTTEFLGSSRCLVTEKSTLPTMISDLHC